MKLHIDTTGYKDKESLNAGIIKTRLQGSSAMEVTIEEIIEEIQKGKTISPAVMKGTKASDFMEQQLFMVDIDNNRTDIPILTLDEALSICNEYHIPPAFYYYSFSHTEEKPKYRLVFILDKVITDTTTRFMIVQSLVSLFNQADTSCTNADRIFYGTDKDVITCDLSAHISIDNVLSVFVPPTETPSNKANSNVLDSELDRLKKEFDFFSYLKSRNGDLKSNNNKYAMFKTCEVCGHNECLVYYYDKNTFYCFGENGNIGGSIIDYLMIVDNLNVSEAINKFKYELCGLDKTHNSNKTTESISLKELLEMDIEEPHIVVENMLCQGFTILGGAPKVR